MRKALLSDAELDLIERQRNDWEFAAYDLLGWEPKYEKQREVLESVQKNSETYVGSANGVGKTDIASVVTLLKTLLGRGIIITTATTWTQVETVLWERMRLLSSRAPEPLGLNFQRTKLTIAGEDQWFAMGLSTREEERFAGYHEPEQMVIVEEATGLDRKIWDAIDGILVGDQDKLFAIYNPLTRETPLYARVQQAKKDERAGRKVKVIEISAFDTPNVISGKVIVPGMVTRAKVEKNLRKWGPNDPRTHARIYGTWPPGGATGLYPLDWIERACNYEGPPIPGRAVAALDVARYGIDRNALAYRRGGHLVGLWDWGGVSTTETSGRVVRLMDGSEPVAEEERARRYTPPEVVRIDADGLGAGAYDNVEDTRDLIPAYHEIEIEEFRAGLSPSEPKEFRAFKDEAYWSFRSALEANQVDLSILTEDQREEIESQALAVGYKLDVKGRRVVDDKETIRRKLGRSPDELEALIMCYYEDLPFVAAEDTVLTGAGLLRRVDHLSQAEIDLRVRALENEFYDPVESL